MPLLLDLPDELLLHIFSRFEDQRAAACLAMGSRRLFALGDVAMRRKFHRVRIVPNRITSRIPKMLIEILKKPHLGEYVRHIELDCHGWYDTTGCASKDGIDGADVERLCAAIRDAEIVGPEEGNVEDRIFPDPKHWQRGWPSLDHVAAEIYAALLASLAPGLTSIACCDPGWDTPKAEFWERPGGEMARRDAARPGSSNYLMRFLQRAAKSGRYVQHLRALRFLSDTGPFADERMYSEVDFYHGLNAVRRLPAITSVSWDASTSSEMGVSVQPPPRSANYSQLAFRHSTIRPSVLLPMIRSAKALTHLTLTLGGRRMLRGHFHALDYHALLDALLEYRDTLADLHIDAEAEMQYDVDFDDGFRRPYRGEEVEEDAGEEAQYRHEWADELVEEDAAPAAAARAAAAPPRALRSLHRLAHLSLGIYTLYYWARGIGSDWMDDADAFRLVEQLPPALETLRIYGRDHGRPGDPGYTQWRIEAHLSALVQRTSAQLPSLRRIEGVDPPIPNGSSVQQPDADRHLLWEREIAEWPEEEDGPVKRNRV